MKIIVKVDDQSYEVEITDANARPILATVDGETFEVWPEETATATAHAVSAPRPAAAPAAPALARAEAAPTAATPCEAPVNKELTVPAPIPGVIISITAKPGDSVKRGQELCVLEAMKMKNVIRAGRDGKIASVQINVGDHVKHGQTLMEFTE